MNVKLKSRTFWFTIWAATFITVTSVFSLAAEFDATWITPINTILAAQVIVYTGGQKWIDSKKKTED